MQTPEMIEEMAANRPGPKPLPEGLTPYRRWELSRRLPYRPMTDEEYRKRLMKKTVEVQVAKTDLVKPEIVQPPAAPDHEVKTARLPVLGGENARHMTTRAALSQMEYALYVETWNKWIDAHGAEYVNPSDIDDIDAICWETVIQGRLRMKQAVDGKDVDKAYDQSSTRMQRAKENLGARYIDRQKPKKGGGNTNNFAFIVGNTPVDQALEPRRIQVQVDEDECDKFLGSTSEKPRLLSNDNPTQE